MTVDYTEVARLVRLGRKSEKRGKAIGVFLAGITVQLVGGFLGGWALMLAVGVAHAEWLPGLPTVGYWPSVLLVLLLRGVFSRVPSSRRDDS